MKSLLTASYAQSADFEYALSCVSFRPLVVVFASRARYYVILLVAILSVSTAGTVFKKIHSRTLLKAWWRLFSTSFWLGIGFWYQNRNANDELKRRYYQRKTGLLLLGSGLALSAHFGTWIASLDLTSLAHSLLVVSCHPLILVAYLLACGKHISRLELGGLFLGLIGMGVFLLDVQSDQEVTIAGDFFALLGAATFVVYMLVGSHLRKWVPLFMYAFPVTFIGSCPLLIGAMLAYGGDIEYSGVSTDSIWGLFGVAFPYVLFLSVVPGILGHTGFNYTVERLSPLIICVALTTEPVFGTIIGMMFGEADTPGVWTLIGACAAVSDAGIAR